MGSLGCLLFFMIAQQNEITQLRLSIPKLTAKWVELEAENAELMYQISKFEDPAHLLKLLHQPEYAHLRFPAQHEVSALQ
jgi:hypothetical protein